MKKQLLLISCALVTGFSYAQKRNNIFVGLSFDNLVNAMDVGDEFYYAENKFLFSLGYERLIGNRIAVSLSMGKYLSGDPDNVNRYSGNSYGTSLYLPQKDGMITYNGTSYNANNYEVDYATFSLKNTSYFKYESKYFFSDFDDDGKVGGYLAANYSRSTFLASIGTVKYARGFYAPSSLPNTIEVKYTDDNVTINRVGFKLGLAYADGTGSDISAGLDFNIPSRNETWNLPLTLRTVSFNVNWIWFIPF